MDKAALGILTILIGLVSYSFYFRDIFKGKTRPEAFSWLIWSILAFITFFAQITSGGGPGAWATGLTAGVCLIISLLAFSKGYGRVRFIDKVSLVGCVISVALWIYTDNPLAAVILVVIIGALGFVPTFIKAYTKPHEETLITFFLNALKFFIASFALDSFNPVTALYPVAMVAMNVSLAILISQKRK